MIDNEIIMESNKKLFESRLQMKLNSSLKIKQINSNKNKIRNLTNLYFLNGDIFSTNISHIKRKNKSGLEKTSNNFIKKNISSENKYKKINKQRNKNNLIINNNTSNIIIKDISFFDSKNSLANKNNFHQIINKNKKVPTYNNSQYKIKEKNSKKRINKVKQDLYINNKRTKIFNHNKYCLSYKDFAYDNNKTNNNIGILNNIKKKISKSKMSISNRINKSMKKRNNSSIKKDKENNDTYQSFFVQKIKIIKKKKKPYLKNISINSSKNNNKITQKKSLNKTGKIFRNFIYQNYNDKYMRNTYRHLFIKKGLDNTHKNSLVNLYYNTNINNSSILNNKKKKSERSTKMNNINKLILKPKKNKVYNNKFNENNIINKIRKKNDSINKLHINQSTHNKTAKEINPIFYNHYLNDNNKYIDKKEEIVDDFNIKSTKTNDDIFSEENERKIEETSIEEESGILSMNEIEDIIVYNNMKDINKEDDYLFEKNDYDNYLSENQEKIYSLFFDKNVDNNEKKKIIKINPKKKINEKKKENKIINKSKLANNNKEKEFKILSYNNSIKKKKIDFFH